MSYADHDLQARRAFIWFQAESELLAGTLTPDRALMHIACSNALRAYRRELEGDVEKARGYQNEAERRGRAWVRGAGWSECAPEARRRRTA